MTLLGSFDFHGMTIEVSRTVGELTGAEALWLRRVDAAPTVTVAVVRDGDVAVTNNMDFRTGSPRSVELERALRAFLAEQGGPAHPGELLGAPRRGRHRP
ncbi:hypothetical protein [Glycomyces buryatensis]|uniref:Uncharacterized protein n=1 Tax=Glycomyces buryatensis TaxID=2570927 RepID=A0A4S8QJH7_9ACTN|nr:hypothetical protein [Glycomyces buryatensis]THV41539.1 hypothetical protein FAB82_10545 [Glycomyces buryatensis]